MRFPNMIFPGLSALVLSALPANTATLVNGSLEGPLARNILSPGWTVNIGDPDTTTTGSAAVQTYLNDPGFSPDGGAWVGMRLTGPQGDSFGQTVTDFVVGQSYTVSWFNAYTGCCVGIWTAAGLIRFDLGGGLSHAGSVLSLSGPSGWVAESFSFTATSTKHRLNFTLETVPTAVREAAYLGIDGITLTTAPVPLPASGVLLLAALGGTAAFRRRRCAEEA